MNSIHNTDEAKTFILNAINKNKPDIAPAYLHNKPAIPAFPKSNKPLLDEFKENLVAGAGTWYEITKTEDVQTRIKTLHPDAGIICSATPEVHSNKDLSEITDPHELDDVDVGIIRASFGVAETGMVWLTEKQLHINALGFLSQHLIILLNPNDIVRDMYEAYARINLHESNYGCFMLGPSATADIGAYMVHGAQGARSLAVFFM